MLAPVAYKRGTYLPGTPLWFDSERSQELCFLTGLVSCLPPKHQRLAASVSLAEALHRAHYPRVVLPAASGRWLQLGGQLVQPWPAGGPLGGSVVLVQKAQQSILVAGLLRQQPIAWPKAEHLVVRVPALHFAGLSMLHVASDLGQELALRLSCGQRPRVLVDSLEVGVELLAQLREQGLPVQPRGLLARFVKEAPCNTTDPVIVTLGQPEAAWASNLLRVDSGIGFWRQQAALRPLPVWRLQWYADTHALLDAVVGCGAREMTLIGAAAESEPWIRSTLAAYASVHFARDPSQLAFW